MYPRRLLGDGEEVLLELHPHWWRLAGPVAAVPVVVGLASFVAAQIPAGRWRTDLRLAVLAVAVLLLVAGSLAPWLRWRTTWYVLTTRRLVVRTGVLARSGRDLPLTRVTEVSFNRTLWQRLLGFGTLVVDSLGERGEVVLTDVPRVEEVQRRLYEVAQAPRDPPPR